MIYKLTGKLDHLADDFVICDVNGVGYQVFIPTSMIDLMPAKNESLTLFIFHYVREDQQTLYGFLSEDMRQVFTILTSISGIGPKLGLKILSSIDPHSLTEAIVKEDLSTLTSISGVGKKMAERIIVELRDKLSSLSTLSLPTLSVTPLSRTKTSPLEEDLSMALKTLGYHQDEIKKALQRSQEHLTPDLSLEQGIKVLLKQL